ncbi:zupT [Symbiodinium microadriaticum]|nr:zupT [Symbiodinium microadriaticum]
MVLHWKAPTESGCHLNQSKVLLSTDYLEDGAPVNASAPSSTTVELWGVLSGESWTRGRDFFGRGESEGEESVSLNGSEEDFDESRCGDDDDVQVDGDRFWQEKEQLPFDGLLLTNEHVGQMLVQEVAVGGNHCILVTDAGHAFAYGSNSRGQLGLGDFSYEEHDPSSLALAAIPPLKGPGAQPQKIIGAACGGEHTLLLTRDVDGTAQKAFICGAWEACGLDSCQDRATPTLLPFEHSVSAVAARVGCSCCSVAESDSQKGHLLYLWGEVDCCPCPDVLDQPTPCFRLERPVRTLKLGSAFGLALDTAGEVFAWGDSTYGELGNAPIEPRAPHSPSHAETSQLPVPGKVVLPRDPAPRAEDAAANKKEGEDKPKVVIDIACGERFSLLLDEDGRLYAFGENLAGQCGVPEAVGSGHITGCAVQRVRFVPVERAVPHHDGTTSYQPERHSHDMEGVDISEGDPGFAMLLTLLAGLATTIGASIAFCANTEDNRVFAICLSLSAGVMAYVSFSEILDMTKQSFKEANLTDRSALTLGTLTVFSGILLTCLLDSFSHWLCHKRQPGEIVISDAPVPQADSEKPLPDAKSERLNMLQMAAFSGIAVSLHNFPEGIATFISTMGDPSFGPAMAFAIAMHNIPEGLVVAAPIKKATGSKCKAFFWAFVSGLSEPLGGLLGWLVLKDILGPRTYGIFYGLTAGIMIHVTFKKLLPTALKYDPDNRYTSYSFFIGMAVMAISLLLGPVAFSELKEAWGDAGGARVFAGRWHSAMITRDHRLYVWGHPSNRKLGHAGFNHDGTEAGENPAVGGGRASQKNKARPPGVAVRSALRDAVRRPRLVFAMLHRRVRSVGLGDECTVIVSGDGGREHEEDPLMPGFASVATSDMSKASGMEFPRDLPDLEVVSLLVFRCQKYSRPFRLLILLFLLLRLFHQFVRHWKHPRRTAARTRKRASARKKSKKHQFLTRRATPCEHPARCLSYLAARAREEHERVRDSNVAGSPRFDALTASPKAEISRHEDQDQAYCGTATEERFPTESALDSVRRLRKELPPKPIVCILGGTAISKPDTEETVKELADALSARVGSRAVFMTGGMAGVQKAFADSCPEHMPLFHLTPFGEKSNFDMGQDVHAGVSLAERKDVYGLLGDLYITIEGGPGVAGEAKAAAERGAAVIPLIRSGGVGLLSQDFPTGALNKPAWALEAQWALLSKEVAPACREDP